MTNILAPQSGRLIALCGVDGVGKTSLVNRLEADCAIRGATYLHKQCKTTINLVRSYGLTNGQGSRNWAEGPFAENAAAATALDFLRYYDEEILPLVSAGELIICDRYALCYQAYLLAVGSRFRFGGIFERLRPADLLIYVDAPLTMIIQRHSLRGGPGEDEHPEVLRRYHEAYLSLIESQNTTDTFILQNVGPIETTYEVLRNYIAKKVSSWASS